TAEFTVGEGKLMTHDEPCSMAPDDKHDLISGTCSHLPYNTGSYADKDLVKYMDVGATYYFNRNMSTYVDYKINLLDDNDSFYKDNGISTDNIVALGLVYQF
ncbi:porin, partial [Klebsiella quasipneumoniae]|uniref:porin n=1 Tax=Klebsiella quasipneumoniae TaxID=1463165 RepID=UPI003A4DA2A7